MDKLWPGLGPMGRGGGGESVCYSLWLPRLGNPGKARLWPKLTSLKDRGPQEVLRALAARGTCQGSQWTKRAC